MEKPTIREMQPQDYEAVKALWDSTEGMYVSDNDSQAAIQRFLKRNPGLCFVAIEENDVVGAILCGDDGRWGILRHLAVRQSHRQEGLGSRLVEHCCSALREAGCGSVVACILHENESAAEFFGALGFVVYRSSLLGRRLA